MVFSIVVVVLPIAVLEAMLWCNDPLKILGGVPPQKYQFSINQARLDAILAKVSSGIIYELVGDSGTGKTALAYSIVASHLTTSHESRVLWIDSNGSFNGMRFLEIIRKKNLGAEVENFAMDRLVIERVVSPCELKSALQNAVKACEICVPAIVVIDSALDILYSTTIDIDTGKRQIRAITTLIRQLSKASSAVFVINGLRDYENDVRPYLGKTWSLCIQSRLLCSKHEGNHFLQLVSTGEESERIPFQITSCGLVDKS